MNRMSAKPSPLKLAEKPGYSLGPIGEQVQVRRHPGHRVDLAAELRHKNEFITVAEVRRN
jgi:hypothetical protein